MNLTIQTLFTDPNIVKAVIDRVLQLRLDTIYWKQYGDQTACFQDLFRNGYRCRCWVYPW